MNVKICKMALFITAATLSVSGCTSAHTDAQQLELVSVDMDSSEHDYNFGISASFENSDSFETEDIVVSENANKDILNTIPVEHGESDVFLDMLDEDNGYLLYCGGPAAGLMEKYIYFTNDRWETYDKIDISSKIDGYPTSFAALSSERLYIGTQLRGDGYLFETTDNGANWESVSVDNDIEHCRYGYVPALDASADALYALLDLERDGKEGAYCLYKLDDRQDKWDKAGTYDAGSDLPIKSFYMYDGGLYIDLNDGLYKINMEFLK